MRERELKPDNDIYPSWLIQVAPHAGARIETSPWFCAQSPHSTSLPMRERELKLMVSICRKTCPNVAPHAGARIETRADNSWLTLPRVAPQAGARIETPQAIARRMGAGVAPHAGARIETTPCYSTTRSTCVAPHAGARIETAISQNALRRRRSLPMRERVREAGLLCPRAVRYCRAVAGVTASRQHRTEK